jgi:multidrug efflux system membrane fusion protein
MRRSWCDGCRASVLVAAIALSAAGAGCDQGGTSQAQPQQKGAPPAPVVTVSKPLQREIIEWDEYTGRFDAVETVDVRARVSGYLIEVHFKDGQAIKQGDQLYVIDRRPFERTLEQAQAELVQARTKVENANLDVERGKPLLERRIMSEKVFDDRANLMREAQAAVKVAEAKVRTAELDLSFTRMTSPLTGRIGRSQVSVGNWVSAGGSANTTLLTTIVSQDPIHIYFDVSENNYIKYKRLTERGVKSGAADLGAAVEIALPDERGFPHKARVDFLDNRLDQGTGTLRARAVIANRAGLFSPGLFARVRVTGTAPYLAVLLPDEAIGTDQTNKYVFAVGEDGTVSRRSITLGPLYQGLRVAREGLTGEEWVITRGLQRARPGQKVTPKRETLTVSEAPVGTAQKKRE